jgi:hypothetical protein
VSQPTSFYVLEAVVMLNWFLVAIGLVTLTVRDWLERHQEDRHFYRHHWRLLVFTYLAIGTAFVLDKSLRLMEHPR